jgi:hypothetical protein
MKKIEKFKKEFEPHSLPDELIRSGLYISGSDTNNIDIERIYDQRRHQSNFGAPHSSTMQPQTLSGYPPQ